MYLYVKVCIVCMYIHMYGMYCTVLRTFLIRKKLTFYIVCTVHTMRSVYIQIQGKIIYKICI